MTAVAVGLAAAIFVATYALIATDRMDRTLAALLGGLAMVVLRIIDQDEAFAAVDFNVIFLLAGMMILAGILRRTGFFQWLAVKGVKAVGGDPRLLLVVLSIVAGLLSAFLDNVTTVVLIAPVTLYLASVLGLSPLPYLISEILASNIGGTATLIGDPPNILIGSAAGLDFLAFLVHLTPAASLVFVIFLVTVLWFFRRDLVVPGEVRGAILALDEEEFVADRRLMRLSLLVLGLTILGFLLQGALGYRPATIALLGAVVLVLVAGMEPRDVLREVEWSTLLFFVGLFILVEGIVAVGLVRAAGEALAAVAGGSQLVATLGLLWLSGVASALVDNIPYTATMIPVVEQLGRSGLEAGPLWWALALGACLGGNATIVGASANVVVASLSAGAGHPIPFRQYLRYGIVVVVESLLVSSLYLWLRYLR